MKTGFSSTLLVLVSIGALAEAKPLPADQHQPALAFSLPTAWMQVVTQDDLAYTVSTAFVIVGATSKTDRLRFDWKSGGKVVGTGKCESDYYEAQHALQSECKLEKPVKATGPIEVDLIYTDDQQEKDYLVTTLKTTIRHWNGVGKSQYWGHVPDDLLAVAFVYHRDDDSRKPSFEFWAARGDYGRGSPTFRCTVNGTKLPDFEASFDKSHARQNEIESRFVNEKENRTYNFAHLGVSPGFLFGPRPEGSTDQMAIDHPGHWDCFLRVDGKPAREFLFVVNDQGMIEQSEMQRGQHTVPTLPGTVLIDMKIPKDAGFDQRIRPDAMRKSIGFGVPWPDSPKAKELQSAFPPASGLAD